MLYDSHAHLSPFSFDASQTIQELLEQADRRKLSGICVTDHYEKDVFYDGGREDIFSLDDYFQTLKPLKDHRPAGSAQLFIGVEIGYLPHLTNQLAKLTSERSFDGVILSLHVLKGADPFTDPAMYRPGKISVYTGWLREMAQMIRQCPDFDILGHFDYVSRYGPYPDRKMRYAEMPEAFDLLLKTLADRGKALEINTRTTIKLREIGYSIEDSWPDPAIINRFKAFGGQYITLGSDAHKPLEAGGLCDEGAKWLIRHGWQQLTHFENRQAMLSPL